MSFGSEWVTIGGHRVLLACRSSFPVDEMRFMSKIIVRLCDNRSIGCRLVKLLWDHKSKSYAVILGTSYEGDLLKEDFNIRDLIVYVLGEIYSGTEFSVDVCVVDMIDRSHNCSASEYISMKVLGDEFV